MKNKTDNKTPSSATEEKKPKQCKKEPVVRGPQDPDAIRTIVVSGLPSGLDKNTLWKKVRKLGGAQNLEFSPDTNADIGESQCCSRAHDGLLIFFPCISPCRFLHTSSSQRSRIQTPRTRLQRFLTLCHPQKTSRRSLGPTLIFKIAFNTKTFDTDES